MKKSKKGHKVPPDCRVRQESDRSRKLIVHRIYKRVKDGRIEEIPEIRLHGSWIDHIGFEPGFEVEAFALSNLIILRPVRQLVDPVAISL